MPVFEAGHGLLLIGLYEEAGRCFDHIAQTFPSREILNNAGVARVQEALTLFPEGELRFVYPLELDAQTRLRQVGDKADEATWEEDDFERRARLLEEAQVSFESARERDETYGPALVNLACVLDLQGKHEDAQYWAGKAARLARTQEDSAELSHALIARGIATVNLNPEQMEATRKDFEDGRNGAPVLAAWNLAALEGKVVAPRQVAGSAAVIQETVGGTGADDYTALLEAPDIRTSVPPGGWGQPAMTMYAKLTAAWDGLLIDTGYRTVVLLRTGKSYDGASGLGIRREDPLTRVEQLYGVPVRTVGGRSDMYHTYATPGIVFQANADGSVQGWMVYGVK